MDATRTPGRGDAGAAPQPPRVAGDPPPRRAAAGRLPHDVPRGRHRLPRPARVRARRRRPPHRLERDRADGHAVRAPVHGGPRAHGLAPARPLAVDGVRPDRPAEGARPLRAGDDLRAAAHAQRQPGRGRALRQRGRGHAAAARAAATRCSRSRRSLLRPPGSHGTITDLDRAARARALGAIRRRSLVVLISDFISAARLGAPAAAADRAPRGRRDPPARPPRVRAARRRRDRGRGRRDRRAAHGRLERRRVPAPAAGGRRAPRGRAARGHPPRRRRHLRGLDRGRPRRARSSAWSSRESGGAADVARLAVAAARPRRRPGARRRVLVGAPAARRPRRPARLRGARADGERHGAPASGATSRSRSSWLRSGCSPSPWRARP